MLCGIGGAPWRVTCGVPCADALLHPLQVGQSGKDIRAAPFNVYGARCMHQTPAQCAVRTPDTHVRLLAPMDSRPVHLAKRKIYQHMSLAILSTTAKVVFYGDPTLSPTWNSPVHTVAGGCPPATVCITQF